MITIVPLVALLALAAGCSWAGCLVPFAAIAAASAIDLRARTGVLLVFAVWLIDQTIGFTLHHYPHDPSTYAWGAALLVASVAAFVAARAAHTRPALALLVAFVAFELVLAAFSLLLGSWEAYAPRVLANIFVLNAVWFAAAQAAASLVLRRPVLRAII